MEPPASAGGFFIFPYQPRISMIVYILFIGLVLLSYGIVRAFSRQSRKNFVVLIATGTR